VLGEQIQEPGINQRPDRLDEVHHQSVPVPLVHVDHAQRRIEPHDQAGKTPFDGQQPIQQHRSGRVSSRVTRAIGRR
jgi:hypothetical protein